MENALHVIKVSKYGDFDVQTSLFSSWMSTRIFAFGDLIPVEIINKVKELEDSPDFIDKVFISPEANWDVNTENYSETEFSGINVETYSFHDARYVQAAVGKIVQDFLSDHDRVTTYVRKSS